MLIFSREASFIFLLIFLYFAIRFDKKIWKYMCYFYPTVRDLTFLVAFEFDVTVSVSYTYLFLYIDWHTLV